MDRHNLELARDLFSNLPPERFTMKCMIDPAILLTKPRPTRVMMIGDYDRRRFSTAKGDIVGNLVMAFSTTQDDDRTINTFARRFLGLSAGATFVFILGLWCKAYDVRAEEATPELVVRQLTDMIAFMDAAS